MYYWYSLAFWIPRHNLTHAQTTRTVAALIRNAYSGQEEAKGLLPLPTVFQMVLSHSRFMEVMLVNPKEQGDEVKGMYGHLSYLYTDYNDLFGKES